MKRLLLDVGKLCVVSRAIAVGLFLNPSGEAEAARARAELMAGPTKSKDFSFGIEVNDGNIGEVAKMGDR